MFNLDKNPHTGIYVHLETTFIGILLSFQKLMHNFINENFVTHY